MRHTDLLYLLSFVLSIVCVGKSQAVTSCHTHLLTMNQRVHYVTLQQKASLCLACVNVFRTSLDFVYQNQNFLISTLVIFKSFCLTFIQTFKDFHGCLKKAFSNSHVASTGLTQRNVSHT